MASRENRGGWYQNRHGFLNIDNVATGLDSTLRVIQDWTGTECPLKLSTTKMEVIPSADSTTAFEVSNAAGTSVLTVNTTTPGVALTGNLATTGTFAVTGLTVDIGTTGTPIVLTAGTPTFEQFTTCASTSGGTNAEGFFVKQVMTGAAGVGGRAKFLMTTNVALGGWSNALKGQVEYGTSGRTAGMGSAVAAELVLSAGTSSGTYAPLESELVIGASGSLGTATSFLYMNFDTTGEAAANAGCFLFELGSNINAASGELFDSTINTAGAQMDHTLKVRVDGATYYIGLMDNADGS